MKPSIGTLTDGKHLEIDVPRLIETRLLVVANSGGGKSWLLRRILEQTASKVQQLVIDPEGEFATLREKHDFVICAPHGGDAVAHPRTAALLARRLLETGVSAVLDIYDLKAHERQSFVRLFCEALVNAPKSLWHPVLVVIDEAHVYAPEAGKSESAGAVIDLATRGRKRGFSLCLATQRIAKLHKDAAAEMLNKLIGRTGLDIDVRRAADEIGMTPKEAVTALRNLDAGQFYAFGPALSREVVKVRVGSVSTTHPKVGQRLLAAPPAPSDKVKKVLAALADLPKEAEAEIHTLAEAKAEIAQLRRTLTVAKQADPKEPATKVTRVEVPVLKAGEIKQLKAFVATIDQCANHYDKVKHAMEAAIGNAKTIVTEINAALAIATNAPKPVTSPMSGVKYQQAPRAIRPPVLSDKGSGEVNLSPMDRAILTVLAQHQETGCQANRLVLLAGYTLNGSTRNSFSKLRTAGYLNGGNTETMQITEAGHDALGEFDPLPVSGDGLRHYWLGHRMLSPMDRAILSALIDNPDGIHAQPLCVLAGYTLNGSTRNSFSKLRTAGLLVGKNTGVMSAAPELLT